MPQENDAERPPAPAPQRAVSDGYRALKSEDEIKTWIIGETRKATSCPDLDLQFVLVSSRHPDPEAPTWELRGASGWSTWPGTCRRAFLEAVSRAQQRFDLR
jgi:hypothetical protein